MLKSQAPEILIFMPNVSEQNPSYQFEQFNALNKNYFSELVNLFLEGDDKINDLLPEQDISKLMDMVSRNPHYSVSWRISLADVFTRQYSGITDDEIPEIIRKNINLLKNQNSYTVTTGQQIHIFLGPLFMVYKALCCIEEARNLKNKYPHADFIPVFWLATEDHDFEEIRTVGLYNEMYTWDRPGYGAVGRLSPESLLPMVDDIENRIDKTETNLWFLNICRYAYSHFKTFAKATQYILHKLLGDTGLLILDPDDATLKNQAKSIFKEDILSNTLSPEIDNSILKMKAAGIKPPINTRPVNTFYLSPEGRFRIEQTSVEKYEAVGGSLSFSKDEINKAIDDEPENFSPNALTRPLYQQFILPNIIYVAGGSEFQYWLELPEMMHYMNVVYPKLVIRKSAFIIGKNLSNQLNKVGLTNEALLFGDSEFSQLLTLISSELNSEFEEIIKTINNDLLKLDNFLAGNNQLQPSKTFRKSKDTLLSELEKLSQDWVNIQVNSSAKSQKIVNLKQKILSNNYNQERNESILNYIADVVFLITSSRSGSFQFLDASTILVATRH
ncbi:MAG: bacillithiol biosynthesis cysteine-adding enzyme BshC [Bacteroidetes bacterium]|nr:bacillithiol biosynthesis cysteine-adding enzyme BshC [Bacteroidota bacterium]